MTQPIQLPLILLTSFPLLLNWTARQDRCWEHVLPDNLVLLVATSDELIPLRYESVEIAAATLSGFRGNVVRGMVFRDLIRKLDTGASR